MRLIVAFLFVAFSFPSWGETLIVRTPHAIVKPVIRKVKLLRSNPHRFTAIRFAGTNPWAEVDDEDVIPQRRHRSQLEQEIDHDDLSDHVRTRLLIARVRALKKFAETHPDLV
jgi:hypothetical protein